MKNKLKNYKQKISYIKIFLLVFILTIFICENLYSSSNENFENIIKNVSPSVVTILGLDDNLKTSPAGTGFFVSKNNIIITNNHVINELKNIIIKTHDGKTWPVTRTIMKDQELDIALLQVSTEGVKYPYLKFSDKIPNIGKSVFVLGSPLGLDQTVSNGIVSAVRYIPQRNNKQLIQITAPISPGSSGSPVVTNDSLVVGIATMQFTIGQNLNFAIPNLLIIKKIANFLEENKDNIDSLIKNTDYAKQIFENYYKYSEFRYTIDPVWFSDDDSGENIYFYVAYEHVTKGNYYYFFDVFSCINNNIQVIYHETSSPALNSYIFNLKNKNFLVWDYTEGSGAYLSFGILHIENGIIDKISSDEDFPSLMREAELIKRNNELLLKTNLTVYKFEKIDNKFQFVNYDSNKNKTSPKQKTLIIKVISGKIAVTFDSTDFKFFKDNFAQNDACKYKSDRSISITSIESIYVDDYCNGSIPIDSNYRLFFTSDILNYESSDTMVCGFLKPLKNGAGEIEIRYDSCWYSIPIFIQ